MAIGFDQFCNTVLGGMPDETFSARCWRCRNGQPWRALYIAVDGLFFWQRDDVLGGHCRQAWMSEVKRRQLPDEYR